MSSEIKNRSSSIKKESAILRGAEILRNQILADQRGKNGTISMHQPQGSKHNHQVERRIDVDVNMSKRSSIGSAGANHRTVGMDNTILRCVSSNSASLQSRTSAESTPRPHDEIEIDGNCAGEVYKVKKKKKKKHEKSKMKKKNVKKSISNADKMMLDYLMKRSSAFSFGNSGEFNPLHAEEKKDFEYLSKKLIKPGMKKTHRKSNSTGSKPGMKKTHRKSNSTGSPVKSRKSLVASKTVCVISDCSSGTGGIHPEDKTCEKNTNEEISNHWKDELSEEIRFFNHGDKKLMREHKIACETEEHMKWLDFDTMRDAGISQHEEFSPSMKQKSFVTVTPEVKKNLHTRNLTLKAETLRRSPDSHVKSKNNFSPQADPFVGKQFLNDWDNFLPFIDYKQAVPPITPSPPKGDVKAFLLQSQIKEDDSVHQRSQKNELVNGGGRLYEKQNKSPSVRQDDDIKAESQVSDVCEYRLDGLSPQSYHHRHSMVDESRIYSNESDDDDETDDTVNFLNKNSPSRLHSDETLDSAHSFLNRNQLHHDDIQQQLTLPPPPPPPPSPPPPPATTPPTNRKKDHQRLKLDESIITTSEVSRVRQIPPLILLQPVNDSLQNDIQDLSKNMPYTQQLNMAKLHILPPPPPSSPPPFKKIRQEVLQNYLSMRTDDEAFMHAINAGLVWQTLVGAFVRFPNIWYNGARLPGMGIEAEDGAADVRWKYISRNRIRGNNLLNSFVRYRSSVPTKGRLLLHIIVRDLNWRPSKDIVIGCYFPGDAYNKVSMLVENRNSCDENVREIFMAIRDRWEFSTPSANGDYSSSIAEPTRLLDPLLTMNKKMEDVISPSPIGKKKHSVNNYNIRAIYGDEPPARTVIIMESELYDLLINARESAGTCATAILLLQEFIFR
mmetsp:Transcript_62303/g.74986  ORF Transcript_62303/g.74986 Transcript_62303/m.74986 type:complete len:895 (-) Transcript_62303:504-3188(-)